MKKRILILGGFGFLGKNINSVLGTNDYEVYNESRRTGCDVLDLPQLKSKLKTINPDIIIFAAANVGSINYVSDYAASVIDDNLQMYLNLYKAVSSINKNIIILNPLANCSYPGIIDVQNESLWWEGEIHESVISYGMSQKTAYVISKCYEKQHGVKTVNLMLSGGYGENDYLDEEKTHAMNGIIMRMVKAKNNGDNEFVVWGTGSPIREWVYMPDIGRVMKEIIDNERYDLPNPLNIGQESGISITDIVIKTKELLNYDVNLKYDTTKQDGAPIKILGAEQFRNHFPTFKFTDYEFGMNKAINYYVDNLTT
jgi:GDP-L-fucose synthase